MLAAMPERVFEAAFAAACYTKVVRFEQSRRRLGNPSEYTLARVFGTTDVDAINALSEEAYQDAIPKVTPRYKVAVGKKATGRWTTEEHDEFLTCLDLYGHNWTKAAERITTRTAAQIRSHAQKYFKKIEAAGEGAPKAARPAPTAAAADGAPQIPAETLAGALGALDDMLRALRSKRARYDDDAAPSEAASDASDAPPVEKRPRAASEGLVIPQAKRSRANSDDRAPGLRRRVTCDDLRALEALELLREAAGGAF